MSLFMRPNLVTDATEKLLQEGHTCRFAW